MVMAKTLLSLLLMFTLTHSMHAMKHSENTDDGGDAFDVLQSSTDSLYIPAEEIIYPCSCKKKYKKTHNSNRQQECSRCFKELTKFAAKWKKENQTIHPSCFCAAKNLHKAAESGCLECCIKFLKSGTPINRREKEWGLTPLHVAAYYDHSDIVNLFINWEADINQQDSSENSALHWSVFNDKKECATILILNGASLTIQDKNGWTPLHHAVKKENVQIVSLFLTMPFLLTKEKSSQEIFNPKRPILKDPKTYLKTVLAIKTNDQKTCWDLANETMRMILRSFRY